MNDEELIAKARQVGAELRGRHGDFDRFAGWLLEWMADRLVTAGAAGAGVPQDAAPEVIVRAWCKRCEHGTASIPCPRCDGPACAGCGRCPPCDGDLPAEEDDDG